VNALWNWFVQSSTSSWVLAALVLWVLVQWLEMSSLKRRMATVEMLFLSEQAKLGKLNSEFFTTRPGEGPYRVSDKPMETLPSKTAEPIFKKGDAVEVRHKSGGAWYRAKFQGFTQTSTGIICVVLESKHTEQWLASHLLMRHAKPEEHSGLGDG